MPKYYSKEQKDKIRKNLLSWGKMSLTKNGYTSISIIDACIACNISKTFFYKFFETKEEYVVEIMIDQNNILLEEINQIGDSKINEEEKIKGMLNRIIRTNEQNLFKMNPHNQMEMFERLSIKSYDKFMDNQKQIYVMMLEKLDKDLDLFSAELVANLVSLLSIIRNENNKNSFIYNELENETYKFMYLKIMKYITLGI